MANSCETNLQPGTTPPRLREQLIQNGVFSSRDDLLIVDGNRQKIYLYDGDAVVYSTVCSTGYRGFGNQPGEKVGPTATGLMYVSDKVGSGEPMGRVFVRKKPTRYILPENTGRQPWVCTRILVLRGLQPENQNTYVRGIYIHGTNRKSDLGGIASGGCIRVSNNAILDLFSMVSEGTRVYVMGTAGTTPELPCDRLGPSVSQRARDIAIDVRDWWEDTGDREEDVVGGEPAHH